MAKERLLFYSEVAAAVGAFSEVVAVELTDMEGEALCGTLELSQVGVKMGELIDNFDRGSAL